MKTKYIARSKLKFECPYQMSVVEKLSIDNSPLAIANRKQGYWNACYDFNKKYGDGSYQVSFLKPDKLV